MKTVYTDYCISHDKAEQLLEKYDQIQVGPFLYTRENYARAV
jgi:hypothetical protein